MKLSRIDQIALNGATGEHYKYEEVAENIVFNIADNINESFEHIIAEVIKILLENFPDA